MMCNTRRWRWPLAVLLACWLSVGTAYAQNGVTAEFVGTTPGDPLPRTFVGGLPVTAPCHGMTWQLTLMNDQDTGAPTTYELVVTYRLPGRNDPNQVEDGPTVKMRGTWQIVRGARSDPQMPVYRLDAENPQRSVSFAKLGEHLLHLLVADKGLMIGNASHSYTLSRKGVGRAR